MTGLRPPLGPFTIALALAAACSTAAHAYLPNSSENPVEEALAAAQRAEAQGQWAQAELWIERALLLQPENAQARLDWARLLLRRGEREAGLTLLESLVTDPRTPEAQRQQLTALLTNLRGPVAASAPAEAASTTALMPKNTAITPTPPTLPIAKSQTAASVQPTYRRQWETTLGYSLNPLAQTNVREVALTLPTGNLILPLESRAQPGAVGGLRAAVEVPSGWLLQTQVQGVGGQGVPSLRLGALYAPGAWWGLYAQAQRLADATRRIQSGAQAVWPFGHGGQEGAAEEGSGGTVPQPLRTTALVGQISLYNEPDIPRQGHGLRATLLHSPSRQWNFNAWVETETRQGVSGPPGWLQVAGQLEYRPRNNIQLSAQVLDHKDSSGYSPLLENNAPRRMKTLSAQLEWAFGRRAQEGWALRLQVGRRKANLPLFAWEDAGFFLVWRTSR